MVYEEVVLDMRQANRFRRTRIPESGLGAQPQPTLPGTDLERTETRKLVPMIEGRSSVGRLGLFVHAGPPASATVGFCGYWTLEMFAVQPVRITPGWKSARFFTTRSAGDYVAYHSDKYQKATAISSRACCTTN